MRILAVGAHPDDIEILCSGTLIKHAQRGDTVFMAYVTNGNRGHAIIKPHDLAEIRKKEAEKATKVVGAEMIWLDIPDEFLYHTHETRLMFIDMIRQAQPDLIITHSPTDYHPDHVRVSDLIFAASFLSSVPSIKTRYPNHPKVVPIMYMDTLAGLNFQPTEYVDISDVIDKKLEALNQHQSQVKWLKHHDNIDILEFVKSIARFRGIQSGVEYAEGFTRQMSWPRVQARELLDAKL